MKSLKRILQNDLKDKKLLLCNDIEELARFYGYKISNAERRMRELVSEGGAKVVKNKKGINIAYKL